MNSRNHSYFLLVGLFMLPDFILWRVYNHQSEEHLFSFKIIIATHFFVKKALK